MKLFGELLKDTLCAERLGDGQYFRLLQQDPLYQTARVELYGETLAHQSIGVSDSQENDAFLQIEYAHEKAQNWFGPDAHIFRHQLLGGGSDSDPNQTTNSANSVTLLTGLAHSCGWLASEVSRVRARMGQQKNGKALTKGGKNHGSVAPSQKKHSKRAQHDEFLAKTVDKMKQLAEHALMALRTEVRIRCQFFLDGVREARYALTEDDLDSFETSANNANNVAVQLAPLPDPFIVELNAELAAVSEATSPFLTPVQRRYLWDGVPSLCAALLSIHALGKMPRRDAVDRVGAAKMRRNTAALQQQLTNIAPEWFREGPFDRVRRFYTLLGQSQTADALLSQIAQHVSTAGPAALTFDEYRALLEYKHRDGRLPDRMAQILRDLYSKRNLHTPRRGPVE
jgi:hypothetical protein